MRIFNNAQEFDKALREIDGLFDDCDILLGEDFENEK